MSLNDFLGTEYPALVGAAISDATGDPRWAASTVSLISGGRSNLTFEILSPAGRAILAGLRPASSCPPRTT